MCVQRLTDLIPSNVETFGMWDAMSTFRVHRNIQNTFLISDLFGKQFVPKAKFIYSREILSLVQPKLIKLKFFTRGKKQLNEQ